MCFNDDNGWFRLSPLVQVRRARGDILGDRRAELCPVPDVKGGTVLRYGGRQPPVAGHECKHSGDVGGTLSSVCGYLWVDDPRDPSGAARASSKKGGSPVVRDAWGLAPAGFFAYFYLLTRSLDRDSARAQFMRYRLGRLLQLCGMLILPQAIVLELLGRVSLGQSLLIAMGGAGVFLVGVGLQRTSGR